MTRIILSSMALLVLTACGTTTRTPNYECSLNAYDRAKCASMGDTYDASQAMARGGHTKVQSVFDPRVQGRGAAAEGSGAVTELSAFPEPGNTGAPVFQQPKVMRVWVGPYVDADGNLRSGEYTYFSTPGHWNYGTLKKAGAASGVFEPSRPGNLGFKAVVAPPAPPAARPARPPEPAAAGGGSQGSTPAPSGAPTTTTGITQPYQRLSN